MNQYRSDHDRRFCYFHPKERVVGICALCLNERLLVLAAKQSQHNQSHKVFTATKPKKPTKIFALTSLLNLLDIKHHKAADQNSHCSSSASPEDSFISIKFGDNGVASWDKGNISKMPHDPQRDVSSNASWDKAKKIKSVVEHAKPRAALRWRRRIGHLFQVIRWKKSSKGSVCHVGTKRTLTKRKAKE